MISRFSDTPPDTPLYIGGSVSAGQFLIVSGHFVRACKLLRQANFTALDNCELCLVSAECPPDSVRFGVNLKRNLL
jgi:hypothetical protein